MSEETKEYPQPPRPLEKMTAKELREYALQIGGITGVHSAGKEQLLDVIKDVLGIEEGDNTKFYAKHIAEAKKEIKALQASKVDVKAAGDAKQVEILRKKVSRLKKKTRKMANA